MSKKWLLALPAIFIIPPVLYVGMLGMTLVIAASDNGDSASIPPGCQPTWNAETSSWDWPGGVNPIPSTPPTSPSASATSTASGSGASSVSPTAAPLPTPGVIDPSSSVAGYDAEQLTNALYITTAATEIGLGSDAQVIGVMTAMGESSLVNIDYGDNAVNPDGSIADSIGLFQQQKWKGTVEERMDPSTSAKIFYTDLVNVDGWESLEPTIAAHRTQGNSDPYHYAPYYEPAVEVVNFITGQQLSATSGGGRTGACSAGNYTAVGTEPGPWGGYENGQIPEYELTPIIWNTSIWLRPDAADALTKMNAAYNAEFGRDLTLNDGYRNLEAQYDAKAQYGDEAAEPGTSNHGWAMAIDFGDIDGNRLPETDATFTWLVEHAGEYGWVNPPWALAGGVGPYEPWHWEYWGKK